MSEILKNAPLDSQQHANSVLGVSIYICRPTRLRMCPWFAAMLPVVALCLFSLQQQSQVYGESMTVATHYSLGSRRWKKNDAHHNHHPSNGVDLRDRPRESVDSGPLPLARDRKLGTFRRCGDSTLFCLVVSEECVESVVSTTGFICKEKEIPLGESSPDTAPPAAVPVPAPAVGAPVAVSEYWDDPKAKTTSTGYTAKVSYPTLEEVGKASSQGMVENYDNRWAFWLCGAILFLVLLAIGCKWYSPESNTDTTSKT